MRNLGNKKIEKRRRRRRRKRRKRRRMMMMRRTDWFLHYKEHDVTTMGII